MNGRNWTGMVAACAVFCGGALPVGAAERLEELKQEAAERVDAQAKLAQEIVDSLFSFAELGFQEFETARYLTAILEENGFTIKRGVAGIPTAWVATWGAGKPVISLGSDVDGLPQVSQKPGVARYEPIVPGAPGHGEGHNSGLAITVTSALAVKAIMEREGLSGTLHLWPGIAEEILGAKAHFVRAGVFDDVDAVLFCHVSSTLRTWWGDHPGRALVSVEYLFEGEEAHGGVSPWAGRSALDAVQLMNTGWEYRREHLRPQQRSHYVITSGGDQPNVVPANASVWYYFRETDYDQVMRMWEIGNLIAKGAAMMTDTSVKWRVLGAAWPRYMNRPLAEAMHANVVDVGMPNWSEDDQEFARAVQRLRGVRERGLQTTVSKELDGRERIPDSEKQSGGSDDIGDVSWVVPTVHLLYPSNIPGIGIHHRSSTMAMATPIAHKGAVAAAKVYARTMLDLLLRPEILEEARDFFDNVQRRDRDYISFLPPDEPPPIWMNEETMEKYRPALREFYYDPERYDTYLEQLGIDYPSL